MFMLDEWRNQQNQMDQLAVETLMEQMNEAIHRTDRNQEELRERLKP